MIVPMKARKSKAGKPGQARGHRDLHFFSFFVQKSKSGSEAFRVEKVPPKTTLDHLFGDELCLSYSHVITYLKARLIPVSSFLLSLPHLVALLVQSTLTRE